MALQCGHTPAFYTAHNCQHKERSPAQREYLCILKARSWAACWPAWATATPGLPGIWPGACTGWVTALGAGGRETPRVKDKRACPLAQSSQAAARGGPEPLLLLVSKVNGSHPKPVWVPCFWSSLMGGGWRARAKPRWAPAWSRTGEPDLEHFKRMGQGALDTELWVRVRTPLTLDLCLDLRGKHRKYAPLLFKTWFNNHTQKMPYCFTDFIMDFVCPTCMKVMTFPINKASFCWVSQKHLEFGQK